MIAISYYTNPNDRENNSTVDVDVLSNVTDGGLAMVVKLTFNKCSFTTLCSFDNFKLFPKLK